MTLHVRIRVRWWLRYYLYAVCLACMLTGMEPNQERVGWWVRRGVRIKLVRAAVEV
ncbi:MULTISPECIES: hypothetical protein [Xanthomonas]|uniref:hypothetical protein n=1 Tax=Xanthomonas TaxID=338 RepID=UPI001C2B89E9|nr:MULTISPECIES: hypothetical protein [Xanthomonas]QXF03600.1 hypothetical protein KJA71_09155 [Xanthomonas citri pv. citri]QXO96856.1 hypothetical protein IG630_24205 [Xanthomonas sp. WG16]